MRKAGPREMVIEVEHPFKIRIVLPAAFFIEVVKDADSDLFGSLVGKVQALLEGPAPAPRPYTQPTISDRLDSREEELFDIRSLEHEEVLNYVKEERGPIVLRPMIAQLTGVEEAAVNEHCLNRGASGGNLNPSAYCKHHKRVLEDVFIDLSTTEDFSFYHCRKGRAHCHFAVPPGAALPNEGKALGAELVDARRRRWKV